MSDSFPIKPEGTLDDAMEYLDELKNIFHFSEFLNKLSISAISDPDRWASRCLASYFNSMYRWIEDYKINEEDSYYNLHVLDDELYGKVRFLLSQALHQIDVYLFNGAFEFDIKSWTEPCNKKSLVSHIENVSWRFESAPIDTDEIFIVLFLKAFDFFFCQSAYNGLFGNFELEFIAYIADILYVPAIYE